MKIGTKVQILPVEENLAGYVIGTTVINGVIEYAVATPEGIINTTQVREIILHPETTVYEGIEYKIVLDTIDALGNHTLVMVHDTHALTLIRDVDDNIIYQSEAILAEITVG